MLVGEMLGSSQALEALVGPGDWLVICMEM